MLPYRLGAVALFTGAAQAWLNSSPFFLFSTSDIQFSSTESSRLASSVLSDLKSQLSSCPTKNYILISQPGVRATDFTLSSSNRISQLAADTTLATRYTVTDLIPDQSTSFLSTLRSTLSKSCSSVTHVADIDSSSYTSLISQEGHHIIDLTFQPLKRSSPRDVELEQARLAERNDEIARVLEAVGTDYTVIYYTSPIVTNEQQKSEEVVAEYQMDEDPLSEILHKDLRRRSVVERKENNVTLVDGPLFDRYQFTTPGLFMGFIALFILLSMLYAGLNALSSLQVTYGAFDKEQGQLAAKKAQ